MASSNADLKTRIATLRHEIFSYKPGKAVPCDDERVVFPDKLVIGIIDLWGYTYNIDVLRRALHGDVEPSKLADKRQTSTEDQREYLTDSISVIQKKIAGTFSVKMVFGIIPLIHKEDLRDRIQGFVRELAGKVGCMVLLLDPSNDDILDFSKEMITMIKEVTGRVPPCGILPYADIPKARNELKQLGVTDIYEVNQLGDSSTDEEQLQWLDLLHGCLQEGDRALATNDLKKICKDPRCKSLHEKTKKEARREVERLQTEKEDERARAEKEKRSLAAEMTKKLESRQQRVDALTDIVAEKERKEATLKQQVEELKKGREGDRARFEKEKQSTELSWKKERDYKEGRLEQLKRETWKLRTKIQLESEIRSAEQKKKAETPQWSLIPWVTSGKQAQGGTSSFEDNSTGRLGRSDSLQAREELPDDEFAGILQQIADDLYDEAKIDSLAGQLGILHGDIQRALMTNVKFNRVTSDGTRHMLKQWRRGVSREDERIELRNALQAAKLVNLADLYLSEGVTEEQIDAESVNKDVNDQQLSTRDETSLEEDQTKGQTETQVLQEATSSNDHTPRDGLSGYMASNTQEDLTDGSRSQHPHKPPMRSTDNLDTSEVTSEDVSSGEVHAGDYMTNVNSSQPAEQSSSHEMQALPEDMSEMAHLVSSGRKPKEESTTLDKSHVGRIISNEEDLIYQLVVIDTSPEKILLLFLVKIIMDVSKRT